MAGPDKQIRVYVDTSVIGGCFDEGFEKASKRIFDESRSGRAIVVISDITLAEIEGAPPHVREFIRGMPEHCVEFTHLDQTAEALAEEYISQQVVSARMRADAQHIAIATIARVDVVVS